MEDLSVAGPRASVAPTAAVAVTVVPGTAGQAGPARTSKPKAKAGPPYDPELIEAVAKVYPARTARVLFSKGDHVKEVAILESTVKRAEPDRRKIDWLWEGKVRFSIVHDDGSEELPMEMTMLYHLAPSGEEWECSRDVTALVGKGVTQHVNLKSPWKDWFEAQVHQAWDDAMRGVDLDRADIGAIKNQVTDRLQISVEEFDDIMNPGLSPGLSFRVR